MFTRTLRLDHVPARPDPLRAAFLVCDLATLDPAQPEGLRERLRTEAQARGGEELTLRNGGPVLAFAVGTAAAARTAIAVQRAAAAAGAPLRMGLHTGSALRHEDVVFGRAVDHACRLAAAAKPGEILVSPLAAGEAGSPTERVIVPFGRASSRLPARRLAWAADIDDAADAAEACA